MDGSALPLLVLFLTPVFINAWISSVEEKRNLREFRRGVHYHSKRHMLASETESRRRLTTLKPREIRKKMILSWFSLVIVLLVFQIPSGHLTPLADDEVDNDEVVSVAIGPPPNRPKYEKFNRKPIQKPNPGVPNVTAVNMIKDIFTQLGRDFLSREISEDFVFGQYVGISMKNLTSDLRLRMQHDILDLIVKYQKLDRGDIVMKREEKSAVHVLKDIKMEKKSITNDTEETWPDFNNLAKIVG